ncbi:probable protein phosphatase 2C 24 [Neltuma alba]|uniref:probable protein phosphatase 2C 24 n=1 Tax=Neltuma alba TaxID=207710 RepID=UPI0010A2DAAD|nr:probable protein phosphatase 2C 24 [Prosopis alba]
MAEICCGVVSESDASGACQPSSREARRRRMEIRRFKVVEGEEKRPKLRLAPHSLSRDCENAVENCATDIEKALAFLSPNPGKSETRDKQTSGDSFDPTYSPVPASPYPKFGVASVCGRRRDMEDAVAVHPWFCGDHQASGEFHYFGVYDGHGCSHVAAKCKDRLHELVKEELEKQEWSMCWEGAMERSFSRMDQEVIAWNANALEADCRCELQSPECDAVGSTAVIAILTADEVIVANCGDSRAVLCRNGKPIPLSSDHKPDRPDELNRIHEAGGRVIFWDGPRVLGMLAMSRAIGDNYLKPYVSCVPEVTITDRTAEDDCLILASDGLWDVVSNETACGVARMCLRGRNHAPPSQEVALECEMEGAATETSDKACSEASTLLTKLALARHSTDNVSVVVVDLRTRA